MILHDLLRIPGWNEYCAPLLYKQLVRGVLVIFAMYCPCCEQAACGEKNDRVKLQNGDHLTGEVNKLAFGQLRLKTDDMGTVTIEWDNIAELTSADQFEVDLSDGSIYYGSLGNTDVSKVMAVINDSARVEIERSSVVNITPVKAGFWSRMEGSVSLGFSYTQANKIFQLNTNVDVTYIGYRNESNVSLSTVHTSQPDVEPTRRLDFNASHTILFRERWFTGGNIGLQSNKELGLDLRVLLGANGGRKVIQTNSEWLEFAGGLQVNRESFTDTTTSKYNVEFVAGGVHRKFRYDDPKLNLSTNLNLYVNLTDLGRVRSEFETSIAWEIIKDLSLNLSFYDSFDSEPPTGAAKNDFSTAFSFGYSF